MTFFECAEGSEGSTHMGTGKDIVDRGTSKGTGPEEWSGERREQRNSKWDQRGGGWGQGVGRPGYAATKRTCASVV